jgi:hypothetical protein
VRSYCRKFALQLPHSALQLREILRVLLGEFVQFFAKSVMLDEKTNDQKGRSEQEQRVETKQEVEKGHGFSSGVPLD